METGGRKMDNFLGTIVFILPGVLAYFWLQAFGINPVVKHSPTEFTAVAGLLWLPVSFGTLILFNISIWLSSFISHASPIWTMQALKDASNNFIFLVVFLLLSVLVSFIYSLIWSLWGFKIQQRLVNWVREKRGIAIFSDSTAVWDEVFGQNDSQIIEFGRIDKPEAFTIIGQINKASRIFEPERNLCIDEIDYMTELIRDYPTIRVSKMFLDTKAGTYIKVFDPKAADEAMLLKDAAETTSSEVLLV